MQMPHRRRVTKRHKLSLPFGGGVSHRLTEGGLMYSYLSFSPTPSRLHRDTPPKEGALDCANKKVCANSFVCTNETSPGRGREAAHFKPLPTGEVSAEPTERDDSETDEVVSKRVEFIPPSEEGGVTKRKRSDGGREKAKR